jgi:hypothetical protein
MDDDPDRNQKKRTRHHDNDDTWIRNLAQRVTELEHEVARLKLADSTRRRNGIQSWLRNPLCPRPAITFTAWFLSELPVLTQDLQKLDLYDVERAPLHSSSLINDLVSTMNKDLVEVMQDIIMTSDYFRQATRGVLPICAFQGCKTMYVWDLHQPGLEKEEANQEPMWIPLTLEKWDAYCVKFQHRFRKALNNENCSLEKDTEEQRNMEQMLERMRKINAFGETAKKNLLAWLRRQLESRIIYPQNI